MKKQDDRFSEMVKKMNRQMTIANVIEAVCFIVAVVVIIVMRGGH